MATSNRRTARGDAPEGLTDLSGRSWKDALKRTVKAFKADKLTDWAAALTYYGVLAIFPALLVVVSVLGLIGNSVTDPLLTNLQDVAPGPAQEIFTNAIRNLQGAQGASGVAFVIGLAAAIWASSGYVNGFMSASNSIHDVEDAGSLTAESADAGPPPAPYLELDSDPYPSVVDGRIVWIIDGYTLSAN